MATDAKTRKKRGIQIAAGAAIVLAVGGGAVLLFSGGEPEPTQRTLGESDSMVPGDPAVVELNDNGSIVSNPNAITFTPGQTSQVFNLLATGAPVLIEDVRLPTTYASAITLSSVDCPPPTAPLSPGSTCSVSVQWDGVTPVSTAIEVIGRTVTGTGEGKSIKTSIALTAQDTGNASGIGGLPTQPGGFSDTTTPTPASGSSPQPASGGSASQPAPQPAVDMGPPQPSLRQQQRDAYLSARRQGSISGISGGRLAPAAKSTYTSWNNIGATGNVSSYPTDMSRVITPDKAITAVISVPIDTRNPVTAVAMVDRDVYGNNGRTVVIPRGSKLIGTPGVSDTRVGIAWKQLIRPDGTRFVFDAESGDAMGRGGVPGRVNERYLQRYGYSLLPSLVSAGITAALGGQTSESAGINGSTQTRDARAVASEILSEPLNRIAQDIYRRKSNIPVQISVPAGTRITVWALSDLRLKPVGERDEVDQQQSQRTSNRQEVNLPDGSDSRGSGSGTQPTTRRDDGPEGDTDLGNYGVGTIDENGNYVAPGTRAPAPSTAPLNRNQN